MMKIGWVKMHGQRRIGILLNTYTRRLYFQLVFFGFFLEFETLNPQLKIAVLAGNKEQFEHFKSHEYDGCYNLVHVNSRNSLRGHCFIACV